MALMNASCVLDDLDDREMLSPEYWDYELQGGKIEAYIRTALQLLLFLTGVPLNLYVIGRILWKRLYSTPTYLLLLNLAFSDLLICLITIPFNVASGFTSHFSFGNTNYIRCQVCKIGILYIMLNLLTTFNVALISLDRFAYFYFPLKYHLKITGKRTALALLGIWGLSIALCIAPLLGYGDQGFSVSCGFIFVTPKHVERGIAQLVVTAIAYTVVVITIAITNLGIVRIACKQIKATTTMTVEMSTIGGGDTANAQEKEIRKKEAKKQFKLFRVFGGILLVNFATILPVLVLVTVLVFTEIPTWYFLFVLVCIMSQVTLHPIVEAFFTPELRVAMPAPCKACCGKVGGAFGACFEKLACCDIENTCTKALERGMQKPREEN